MYRVVESNLSTILRAWNEFHVFKFSYGYFRFVCLRIIIIYLKNYSGVLNSFLQSENKSCKLPFDHSRNLQYREIDVRINVSFNDNFVYNKSINF